MASDGEGNGSAVDVISKEEEQMLGEEEQHEKEQFYHLTVVLPPGQTPRTIKFIASPQETPTDLRQNLISHPSTQHLTNIHFEHESKPLNEFMELSLIPDLPFEASLSIVQDSYNERTIRAHFLRMKELISPPGTGFKGLGEEWGIAPGSTLAEFVQAAPAPNPSELGKYFSQPLLSLSSVIAPSKPISHPLSTVKSLLLSQWNPPPPNCRTQGDLLYITFTSLEGDLYHITGHIRGFYVSRSTNQKFDPTPKNPQKLPSHSLLTLLQSLSPQFASTFAALHPSESSADILSDAPLANALPAFPWLVNVPQISPDSARIQRPWLEILTEGQSNLRDWNDEIQSTRALPTSEVRERLVRERMLQKSLADFAACATQAALLVRRGELVPLDPVPETHDNDEKRAIPQEVSTGTMWHYNNIFLSLGAEDVLRSFEAEGGGEASRVAVGKDVVGVARVNSLLLESTDEQDCGLCTLGTVIVDYLGERLVAQSVVPGIFQQAPDAPGHREDEGAPAGAHKIVYGGVDNGEKVFADAEFDERFRKIMDKLHIKQHDVWEIPAKHHEKGEMNGVNGDAKTERRKRALRTSLETKGLRGADGRNYVLDLYKLAPVDIAFLEEHHSAAEDSYPHRMAFLRNECVDAFWESKLRAWVAEKLAQRAKQQPDEQREDEKTEDSESNDSGEKGEETPKEDEKIDISDFEFALNPDVFTPSQAPVTEEEKKRLEEDEADVRACCAFLRETLIPGLMKELSDGSGGWPVDGKSLTSIMHRNGVNIRLLATVVSLCGDDPKLQAVKTVAIHEMVSRGAKHAFSQYLRRSPLLDVPGVVAHLLNCLVGFKLNPNPEAYLSHYDEFSSAPAPEWTHLDAQTLQGIIERELFRRFRFTLPDGWWNESCSCIVLLREVCLKLGFQLKARDYVFEKVEASCPGKPKKANGTNGHKVEDTTFYPGDILNVVPVIKDAPLKSALAEEALDAGKTALFQGQRELGLDLLAESLSLHEQIYGVLHPDVSRGYSKLSLIYNQIEEMRPAACELARKAVIVSERTLGLDNQETILNWLNWALCEHGKGNTKQALGFILHVLRIWRNIFGDGHPDENNVAVMLQSLREHHASLPWFEKALALCVQVHGKDSLNAATISFQYSQALALAADPISAVPKMRDAYAIFARELGPEDRSTKETALLLQHFTTTAVNVAKQVKLGKKVAAPKVNVTAEVQPVGPEAGGIGSRGLQNIDELVKYIGAVDGGTTSAQKTVQKKRRGGKR